MPLPTQEDVHVNELLTEIAVAFIQSDEKFVATKVFPRVGVMKQTGLFAQFDRGDFMRPEMKIRRPMTESAGGGYRVTTTSSYACDVWSLHKDVSNQEKANQSDPFNADKNAATYLAMQDLLTREAQFATNFFTTGLWTGSTTGTDLAAGTDFTAWDNVASTPIEDVNDQMAEVESNTGQLPNVLVINRRSWFGLKNHPDIVDRIKHVSKESITTDMVANLMELERILVSGGASNTAGEGLTATTDYQIGNHALLAYAAPNPDPFGPSAGYTFAWDGLEGGSDAVRIDTFPMAHLKGERHEIESAWQQKVVSAICGVFYSNVVS